IATVALGIASQVRSMAYAYFDANEKLRRSKAILKSAERVLKVARTETSKDSLDKLAETEAEADVVYERIEELRALGEANAALAGLYGVMGTNYNEPCP
ncbi:MAG: hypothetical protein V2B18_22830, partial [Pseudomonadota bacterium]